MLNLVVWYCVDYFHERSNSIGVGDNEHSLSGINGSFDDLEKNTRLDKIHLKATLQNSHRVPISKSPNFACPERLGRGAVVYGRKLEMF